MEKLTRNIDNFLELFFPALCTACGNRLVNNEKFVCFECWSDLPVTNFHESRENKVAQLFWGRVNIEFATSYFSYKKGSRYQQIIHQIKYKGLKELGFEIGKRFGFVLRNSDLSQIDCIVPVPLHPRKVKRRGFNQSDWIAHGIAEIMEKPVFSDHVIRKVFTGTQTRKNRFQRWKNVEGIFEIRNPEDFVEKHILLIDDVVTTGSTLEACAHPILNIEKTKVSIATLAFADF